MPQVRPRDLYSFRRMLIVLLATVVGPVFVLAAVGFVAVKNERAAIEREVEQTFAPRLEELSKQLSRQEAVAAADPQRLADARFGVDGTRYVLEPVGAEGAVVAQRLATPHDSWQVGVYEPFGRSITARLVRNRVVYIATIVIFFAAVVTGAVIIGRAWYINQRLARLQTDFVSNVSHELRTPLTSIRMFVETLQMDRARDPQQVKECLDLLAAETERLSGMIERMLNWARMEAGRRVYTLEPTPVASVVDRAVRAFRAQRLGEALPDLAIDVPPGTPDVVADGDALADALLNLLSNAFKYGGGKRVDLRARADGAEVVFEVEDQGVGISPRDRKRIFDKFYRAEQLLSRKTEGIGLGLSIVRHVVVEGHNGRIECESEPGKGTKFRIRIAKSVSPATATRPSGASKQATVTQT